MEEFVFYYLQSLFFRHMNPGVCVTVQSRVLNSEPILFFPSGNPVKTYCCRCARYRTALHLARRRCEWWHLPDGAGSRAGFLGISTGQEQTQYLHSAGWCLHKKKTTTTKPTHNLKQSRNPTPGEECDLRLVKVCIYLLGWSTVSWLQCDASAEWCTCTPFYG